MTIISNPQNPQPYLHHWPAGHLISSYTQLNWLDMTPYIGNSWWGLLFLEEYCWRWPLLVIMGDDPFYQVLRSRVKNDYFLKFWIVGHCALDLLPLELGCCWRTSKILILARECIKLSSQEENVLRMSEALSRLASHPFYFLNRKAILFTFISNLSGQYLCIYRDWSFGAI